MIIKDGNKSYLVADRYRPIMDYNQLKNKLISFGNTMTGDSVYSTDSNNTSKIIINDLNPRHTYQIHVKGNNLESTYFNNNRLELLNMDFYNSNRQSLRVSFPNPTREGATTTFTNAAYLTGIWYTGTAIISDFYLVDLTDKSLKYLEVK